MTKQSNWKIGLLHDWIKEDFKETGSKSQQDHLLYQASALRVWRLLRGMVGDNWAP